MTDFNSANPARNPNMHRFGDVTVRLSVELGRTELPLKDVLSLDEGSVVALNRLTDELLDVTANGHVVARGEVVAQDGKFALRIISMVDDDAPAAPNAVMNGDMPASSAAPGPNVAGRREAATQEFPADTSPASAASTGQIAPEAVSPNGPTGRSAADAS